MPIKSDEIIIIKDFMKQMSSLLDQKFKVLETNLKTNIDESIKKWEKGIIKNMLTKNDIKRF